MSTIGNKEVLARNLARFIDESGKSRADICQELGIAYSTFSEWANGRKYPRIDKIELIANYFGVKKSELIEDNNTDTPNTAPDSPKPTDEDIKFALFDGSEGVTDEMYDEVKRFAKYIKEQNKQKEEK